MGAPSGTCVFVDLALVCACQAQSTQFHCNHTVLWAGVISSRARYSKIKAITQKKPTIQPKCQPLHGSETAALTVRIKRIEVPGEKRNNIMRKEKKKVLF